MVTDTQGWKKINERYPLKSHTVAEARLSQCLQDVLSALRQGNSSLGRGTFFLDVGGSADSVEIDLLLEGLSSDEKHFVISDIALIAYCDVDIRARLLIQASNGLEVLRRTSKASVGHLAHIHALIDCLSALLQDKSLAGASLASEMARSYTWCQVSNIIFAPVFFV